MKPDFKTNLQPEPFGFYTLLEATNQGEEEKLLKKIEETRALIQIMGNRTCMVKPSFLSKLIHASKPISKKKRPRLNKDHLLYPEKIDQLNQIKEKRSGYQNGETVITQSNSHNQTFQNKTPYICTKSRIETSRNLHLNLKDMENRAQLYPNEEYSRVLHNQLDMILKGTKDDPIGRAQFVNFINRLSQTYYDTMDDIKPPKEK